MKKVLLFSILFLLSALFVQAYETIIINYPDNEKWENVYYKKRPTEALLQFVPAGSTSENWTKTIVVHSYKDSAYPINIFINNNARRMMKANPTARYRTLKMSENDALLTRCTHDYKNIQAQCEFFKATRAHEGIVTVHYINRDKEDFMKDYTLWLEIIKNVKFLNSYYRDERTFNKNEFYELW